MTQATERNERRNENPTPHPEPLEKVVKTHFALASSGVRTNSATQIARLARILIGANQITISCRLLVVKEQMVPKMMRKAIERRTSWRGVLLKVRLCYVLRGITTIIWMIVIYTVLRRRK